MADAEQGGSRSGRRFSGMMSGGGNRRPVRRDPRTRQQSAARAQKRTPRVTVLIVAGWIHVLPLINPTSDFIAPGESADMIGRAESQRLNGHGRLASTGRDEARAVAEEQIRHVVGAVILVDDGTRGIVGHSTGAEQ